MLNKRVKRRETLVNEPAAAALEQSHNPVAVILGYGPVGRAVEVADEARGEP